jgi:hypothetical protein
MRPKWNLTLLKTKFNNVAKTKEGATLGAKDEQNRWIRLKKKGDRAIETNMPSAKTVDPGKMTIYIK